MELGSLPPLCKLTEANPLPATQREEILRVMEGKLFISVFAEGGTECGASLPTTKKRGRGLYYFCSMVQITIQVEYNPCQSQQRL